MKFNKTQKKYREINDHIRGSMRRKKISQSDLGYRLNLSHAAISKRLSGQTDWSLWEILLIEEILDEKFMNL